VRLSTRRRPDAQRGREERYSLHRCLRFQRIGLRRQPSVGLGEPDEESSLAFVAAYGINCYLISQDIAQLKSRESGYGPDETITSNCHIQSAFPPNRLDTAEHLSKLTGQTTIIKEQVTRSGRGLGSQVSRTMHEVQRPLLTPDECLRMPGPQKNDRDLITTAGDIVVYCAGFPAIYGRQPLYFQDPTFAARAAVSAPKHSHSLQAVPLPEVPVFWKLKYPAGWQLPIQRAGYEGSRLAFESPFRVIDNPAKKDSYSCESKKCRKQKVFTDGVAFQFTD
jgi:type IV secretion system protein VirD4